MDIRIINKSVFKSLLRKEKTEPKLLEALFEFNGFDKTLPSDYKKTALRNDLQKDAIRLSLLTGIIYLLFGDHHSDRKIRFKYTLVDIQKIFKHFDKSDLVKHEHYRERYNELIKKLTDGNDDLKGTSINENWEIEGSNSEEILYVPNQDSDKSLTEHQSILNTIKEFFNKNRRMLGYIFGFLFSFVAFIVLPIASIGIDRTRRSDLESKIKRRRIWIYSSMILLFFIFTIIVNYKAYQEINELYEGNGTICESAFDTVMLGQGFVVIENKTKDGGGKVIGQRDNVGGQIGDTIIVGVLISNTLDIPILNVKVEMSPKNSINNTKHTFFGSITGYNVATEFDSAYLTTAGPTSVRYINNSYIQRNNALSDLIPLDDREKFSLFSGGITFHQLFPGAENYVVVTSMFVIEPNQK